MKTKPPQPPASLPPYSLRALSQQLQLLGEWIERGRAGGPGNEKWAQVVPALIRVSVALVYDCVAVLLAAADADEQQTRAWLTRHLRWLDTVGAALEAGDSGPNRTARRKARR